MSVSWFFSAIVDDADEVDGVVFGYWLLVSGCWLRHHGEFMEQWVVDRGLQH